MDTPTSPVPFDLDAIISVVSSLFAELNLGLLIYHLEQAGDPRSLKLIYANRAASEYTHADLRRVVGKYILDAFPGLAKTELPQLYVDVVQQQKSRNLGATQYEGDSMVEAGYYSVKAFPMPNNCVGIVFENVSVQKRLQEVLKRRKEEG